MKLHGLAIMLSATCVSFGVALDSGVIFNLLPAWQRVLATSKTMARKHSITTSGPTPGPTGFAVSPIQFGGDPLGVKDSTLAVRQAVQVCVNVSQLEPGTFPVGMRDAAGCTVDLQGGEYLISDTITIPPYVANLAMSRGSLRASASFTPKAFMVVVGAYGACDHPQGSCNVDINFPGLFLDGARSAHGLLQINSVMGTTVGPGSYMLNFTGAGVEVNGGHEVMISETWFGETNWDHHFTTAAPPVATAIAINSNDHYIQDSIVFSALVGLDMRGAANFVSGLHVWFPWNDPSTFDATAFYLGGSQNRYSGCYVDSGKAVIPAGSSMIEFSDGFVLGGQGILLEGGSYDRLQVTGVEFQGGSGPGIVVPQGGQQNVTLVDSRLENNLFNTRQGTASRVTKTVTSTTPLAKWTFDFCSEIVGRVQAVTQLAVTAASGFPNLVARPVATDGCTVTAEADSSFSGSVTMTVDSSSYSSLCGLC